MSVDTALTQPAVTRAPAEASQRSRVLRRLRRNPLAVASFTVLAVAVVVALLAPWLAPYAPEQTDFSNTFAPPGTPGHLLGTDDLGRDVLSRIMLGAPGLPAGRAARGRDRTADRRAARAGRPATSERPTRSSPGSPT